MQSKMTASTDTLQQEDTESALELSELPPLVSRGTPSIKKHASFKKRIKKMFKKRSQKRRGSRESSEISTQNSMISLGTIDLDTLSTHEVLDDGQLYEYNEAFNSYPASLTFDVPKDDIVDQSSEHSDTKIDASKNPAQSSTVSKACDGDNYDLDSGSISSDSSKPKQSRVNRLLTSMYVQGKEFYSQGLYEKAWSIQSKVMESVMVENESGTFNRQQAMVAHELAKIKYAMYMESDHDHDQQHLIELHNRVENTKCKVSLQNLTFYQHKLREMESQDTFDISQINERLYILHILGQLCEKDLHRYEEALEFYQRALSIEDQLQQTYRGSTENSLEMKEWAARVRHTSKKIGSIHYTMGRFDLALFSSTLK